MKTPPVFQGKETGNNGMYDPKGSESILNAYMNYAPWATTSDPTFRTTSNQYGSHYNNKKKWGHLYLFLIVWEDSCAHSCQIVQEIGYDYFILFYIYLLDFLVFRIERNTNFIKCNDKNQMKILMSLFMIFDFLKGWMELDFLNVELG